MLTLWWQRAGWDNTFSVPIFKQGKFTVVMEKQCLAMASIFTISASVLYEKCPGPQHLNISELAPNSSRRFLENHRPLLLTSPSIFPCAVRESHPQLCSRLAAVVSLCSARIPRGLSRSCWLILLYSLRLSPIVTSNPCPSQSVSSQYWGTHFTCNSQGPQLSLWTQKDFVPGNTQPPHPPNNQRD